MRKGFSIFLVAVVSTAFVFNATLFTQAKDNEKIDYSKPLKAENVHIGKKIQIKDLDPEEKGRDPKGKPTKPPTSSYATGVLGDPMAAGAQKYAIIVGISDYYESDADLNYGDDDALEMKRTLMEVYGYPEGNIIPLLDHSATFNGIQSAIDNIKSRVVPGDEVVFFYSGHGSYGNAYDGDTESVDESIWVADRVNIWDTQLKDWFSNYQTDRIIFIFDSCFSGGMTDLSAVGRVVNMASQENKYSYEVSSVGHGVFTYYFVEQGMRNGLADTYDSIAGVKDVTVEEAFAYTVPKVRKYQAPVLSDSYANDLLLSYY